MLVYPKADKVESEVPLFKYEAFTDNSDRLSGAQGGYQEFRSLRKYVPSDPMKLINWGFIGCGEVTEKKSGPAFNEVTGSRWWR